MIGAVTKAFVEAIRASELVEADNISVVLANDDGEGTVNTALPAIAVAVKGSDNEKGEFISGMPENEYIVQLAVITNFDNQAASEDMDHQFDQMDIAYNLMLYLHKAQYMPFFDDLRKKYDFSMKYNGVETQQTRGMASDFEIDVFVFRLVYTCTFLSKEIMDDRAKAPLEKVIMEYCNPQVTTLNVTMAYYDNSVAIKDPFLMEIIPLNFGEPFIIPAPSAHAIELIELKGFKVHDTFVTLDENNNIVATYKVGDILPFGTVQKNSRLCYLTVEQ
jgi:hypothetical protein